jgi:O-antigen ligase
VLSANKLLLSVILAVFIFVGPIFFKTTGVSRLLNSLAGIDYKTNSTFSTVNDRIPYWKMGYAIFKQNPVFGTGVGRYLLVLPDFMRYKTNLTIHNTNESACNLYIQIAAETGVFGVVIFIGILVIAAKKSVFALFSDNYTRSMAAIVFIAFLLLFFVGLHIQNVEVSMLFWLMASIVLAGAEKKHNPFCC